MHTKHSVDLSKCKKCHICAEICPAGIIASDDAIRFLSEREGLCIRCGQCMAACPPRAIFVEGLSYDHDFFELPQFQEGWKDAFFGLISTRRSIRNFKNKPVPRELLEKIVQAISFAPPGFTPLKLELTVVTSKEMISRSVPLMADMYDGLIKTAGNPVGRFTLKRIVGEDTYNVLTDHVLPLMKVRIPGIKAGTEDTIARGAPAMILFHSPENSEDFFIALAYGLLAAHSLELGACAIGLIPPAVERNRELKKIFKIPVSNRVMCAMVLGYPEYKYSFGIKRNLARVTWVE